MRATLQNSPAVLFTFLQKSSLGVLALSKIPRLCVNSGDVLVLTAAGLDRAHGDESTSFINQNALKCIDKLLQKGKAFIGMWAIVHIAREGWFGW